jgi:hypothetical protein
MVLQDGVSVWQAYPKRFTTSIMFSGVQVPPLAPHWLSTMGYTIIPRHHLSFIISYWVILKYVFLGIGQILEAGLLVVFTSLCGGKASL